MAGFKKILLIRFSSIGDIVLTSPVPRALKSCWPEAEIHFLTKPAFVSLISGLEQIDKIHSLSENLEETIRILKGENFDQVIDLHRSIRSGMVCRKLGKPTKVISKSRFRTWLYVKLKFGKLPGTHVVERYFQTLSALGCKATPGPLEIVINNEDLKIAEQALDGKFKVKPVAIVLGATWFTKRWPTIFFIDLINRMNLPVILIGGQTDRKEADEIIAGINSPVFDAVGNFSLLQSAALMKSCRFVITHDTGFMHIAAALKLKIFSIWGQTVPALGFSPWMADNTIIENKNLACRPCSKIGFDKCPKGHFRCMMEITPEMVYKIISE